jgi:hypothetical protein
MPTRAVTLLNWRIATQGERNTTVPDNHVPDNALVNFINDFRERMRERLDEQVVSPFARETIRRALKSGRNDREHDALVIVAEELGIDWTAEGPQSVSP